MNAFKERRESGQVLVLFALAILGIVALVGLVVDGGFLYVQRRTAQTAADAGALAGARALREGSSTSSIAQAATTAAQANTFGTTPSLQCISLVGISGSSIGTLSGSGPNCTSGSTSSIDNASGVHVDVQINYPTILAGILRISTFTAEGHATAQLARPGGLNTTDSPLIVCGGGTSGAAARVSSSPPVTIQGTQITYVPPTLPTYNVTNNNGYVMEKFLDDDNTIDKDDNGHVYYLKGPVIGQATDSSKTLSNGCGAHSNTFDGGASPGQNLTSLPGTLLGTNGNTVANIGSQVDAPGGCAGGTSFPTWAAGSPGCIMILPVANGAVDPSSNTPNLIIPTEAAFYVWCNKSNNGAGGTQCQEYVGQLVASEDVTGNLLTSVAVSDNSPPTGPIAVHLTL